MTITIPETAEGLEELLNDGTRMAEIFAEGKLGDVTASYAKAQMEARSGELGKQIRDAAQTGMGEWLKDHREDGMVPLNGAVPRDPLNWRTPAMAKAHAKARLFNKRALGAPLDKEPFAESMGAFLQAVWHRAEVAHPENIELLRSQRRTMQNALFERVPSEGGFLVPEVLRSELLMVMLEHAVIRPRARIVPMDSLRVPYPTIDDTSHTSSVFGGVAGFWTEEAAALAQSQPAFGRIVLEAKKLTGYTQIPNELLQDANQALDQWFSDMFPIALAFFEDVAFISGSGAGQPQGFLNSPCAVVTGGGASGARVGGAASAVQYGDITAMYSRLLPMSMNSAIWLCSPDVLPGLMQLVTASGIAPPLWLRNWSAADGYPGGGNGDGYTYEILGRPLIVTEKMPALASQGCLALFDPNYYLLGDRMSMQVSSSEHYQFANDLTVFRVIERVDGRTWIQSAITPENGSANTLSPVVLLHA